MERIDIKVSLKIVMDKKRFYLIFKQPFGNQNR